MIAPTNAHGLEVGRYPGREDMQPEQVSQLIVINVETGNMNLLLESDDLVQSPNWTSDDTWIVVNSLGKLWRVPADGSGPMQLIDTGDVCEINNDHVLSPDGKRVYFSAGSHPGTSLFSVDIGGGSVRRISNEHPSEDNYSYFVHGVSYDDTLLAYTSVQPEGTDPRGRRNIVLIPTAGGEDIRLTEGASDNAYNGSEFSPDGEWIYYNSEEASVVKGHQQIFRMHVDGTGREQLTFDDRVNWFPHLSPDGRQFVYQSYPAGVDSHPADMPIELRLLAVDGGEVRTVARLFGGQGTMNCNSWAPDGHRFAFIAYPSTREALSLCSETDGENPS